MSASSSTRAPRPDLGRLAAELRAAWTGVVASPALQRLAPAQRVRLLGADRTATLWRASGGTLQRADGEAALAPFTAVELPDDRVLLRTLRLPRLGDDELANAVALEAATCSPFPSTDTLWGWACKSVAGGQLDVVLALASRSQVQAHLVQANLAAGAEPPEVWVRAPGFDPIVLPGFGEARRLARQQSGRRLVLGLAGLGLLLVAAMAATPAAQTRLRAIAAVESMDALVRRAEPATRQRAALVQTLDQASALSEVVARAPQPLVILNLLTQTLPDDTSLLGLQVDGAKVTINGLTTDAAALMQLLSARPEFKDVKAPSAATRPLGSNKDLFTIEFTLAPVTPVAGTTPAPAAGAPAAGASSPMATPASAAGSAATGVAAQPAPTSGGASFGGGAAFGGAPARKP